MRNDPDTSVTGPIESEGDESTTALPPHHPHEGLPPGGLKTSRRRRWLAIAVTALLVVGGALGGLAVGHAVWAPDERSAVQEYTQEPHSDGELPWGSDQPSADDSHDDQPYGDWGSGGSSGAGASTVQGPSASEVQAIAARVSPAVVNIDVRLAYGGGQGAGTGMVLTPSGVVLTNNHVIDGAGEISVTTVDGTAYSATVLGYDVSRDVALLQLEDASGLSTVTVGGSSSLTVGDEIVVIGNAGGDGGEPTASGGSVTALDQQIVANGSSGAERLSGLIQVSADVRSGQSGGPVVKTDGEVVGMITAASLGSSFRPEASGTGYAVPIDQALAIARQIEDGQSSGTVHVGPTAFLGVRVSSSVNDVVGPGPDYGGGAPVADVLPGTPAARAGLQSGDTIVSVDGSNVESAERLSELLRTHRPGDRVTVVWLDQLGERHAATVALMEGPPA